jgi:hypothetical protein
VFFNEREIPENQVLGNKKSASGGLKFRHEKIADFSAA